MTGVPLVSRELGASDLSPPRVWYPRRWPVSRVALHSTLPWRSCFGRRGQGRLEAGAAGALIEHGVPVRLVAGSSAGALDAAMLADGRLRPVAGAVAFAVALKRSDALRPGVLFAAAAAATPLALDHVVSLLDPSLLRELIAGTLYFDRVRASPRRCCRDDLPGPGRAPRRLQLRP